MTQSRTARVLLFLAASLSLVLAASCSKKLAAPDASFQQLEGSADGKIFLVGWQHPRRFMATWLDPGSPFDQNDDVFADSLPIAPDSVGRIETLALDASVANGLQVYRAESSGALVPLLDYPLAPFLRWLASQVDVFQFEDAHANASAPSYVARGSLNGTIGSKSSVSNFTLPYGAIEESMTLTSGNDFRDSIATLSWSTDPRAVLYLVDVLNADEIGASRAKAIISNFPIPVFPSASTQQLFVITPGNTLPLDFTGAEFPVRLVLRVFALDANYRIVNRLNPGSRTLTRSAPLREDDPGKFAFTEAPIPNFNAYSVIPAGGARIIFNPFNQHSAPGLAATSGRTAGHNRLPEHFSSLRGLTAAQARALVESRARASH